MPDVAGRARVLGYQTEIRRGATGLWTDRRTFFGRAIGGAIYANLDNGIEYQLRVRAVSAEGDCGWSAPVSAIPSGDLAPRDEIEHVERFGPHPIGTDERNFRLLTPGRCRHTVGGVNQDADCDYVRISPTSGRITLEFDDPSRGSCDVRLAYSSLTAGSFIDECFGAGVNTNVPFDRSFRMPHRAPRSEGDLDPPPPETSPQLAPRDQDEFDALVFGRDDFIPGLCFGHCLLGDPPEKGVARVLRIDADGSTGEWYGDYTYENTGPSQGVVTLRMRAGGVWTFTLDFEPWGNVRASIMDDEGGTSTWPGTDYVDLTLGAQPILLPIPPSWSAAVAVESDIAPADVNSLHELVRGGCANDTQPLMCALLGDAWNRAFIGPDGEDTPALVHDHSYRKVGPNRGQVTVTWNLRANFTRLDLSPFQLELLGTTWVFDLTFRSDEAADVVFTIAKDGYLPSVDEEFIDFVGDGTDLETFPYELRLPDDPPQASGEDVSGVEVAAAATSRSIGDGDVQTFLVSNTGATYSPGDWLEPKDGSDQRMMIVGTGQTASAAAVGFTSTAGLANSAAQVILLPAQVDAPLTLSVVCMQFSSTIPVRGARYFSRPKAAETAVQRCQRDCVLAGGDNIQGCVWRCERTASGSAPAQEASGDFGTGPLREVPASRDGLRPKGSFPSGSATLGQSDSSGVALPDRNALSIAIDRLEWTLP